MKNAVLGAAVAAALALPFAAQAQSIPAPGSGSLDVWFKAPTAGATISGVLNAGTSCYVNGTGVTKVQFFLDSTALNTDSTMSDGMQCQLDTTKFANGTHSLTAVAYSSTGATRKDVISVNIQNIATPANTAPTVSLTSPTANQYVSGSLAYAASATDNVSVSRVDFSLDGKALVSDTTSPYGGTLDTTTLANGAHTLVATAYDGAGLSATSQVVFNVQNATTTTTSTPPPGSGSLDVWFKAPTAGKTISGVLNGGTSCYVNGTGVTKVDFYLDSTKIGSDTTMADGMQCVLDTTKFANGTHSMKAVATSSTGSTRSDVISVNIQNSGTTTGGGTTTNTAPTVTMTAPAAGTTVSGTVTYSANATDDAGVSKVDFFVDNALQISKTAAPYSGTLDTTKLANGAHVIKATAYDAQGLSSSSQVSVNVSNTSSASLPAGGSAVATFHSIGLYWKPTSTPSSAGCDVQFRPSGTSAWQPGLNLWYDSRNAECRGSLVQLQPGTQYDVQFGVGGSFKQQLSATTWGEQFPVARVVSVPPSSSTLNITEGGTAGGYVVYDGGGATIDVANGAAFNISVNASYVIVRNFVLKGAQQDGIRIQPAQHDVVIEANDISGWGRYSGNTTSAGWQIGVDMDSGISAKCGSTPDIQRMVIQRNRIHDPRYGANSWDWGHPAGPNAVFFSNCGGNNVIRYNEVWSTGVDHYFMDALGGEDNFSNLGYPGADSDVYGNRISNAWDDGIEAEGGGRNVRVWGNYIDQTATGVASTAVAIGPIYIFRNVYNRSRQLSQVSTDQDDRNKFAKSGTETGFGDGRRYVLHNTLLQATASGATYPLGAGQGVSEAGSSEPMTNSVIRNNILHIWKSNWASISSAGGGGNDADYDLFNGAITISGQEAHGIVGTPIYASGNGWQNEAGGMYQLAPSSPGYDKGVRIPNFNDGFTGAGPDMGAHEAGTPAMKFGVNQ
ncbi:MAG: Ig-like domain-containing protein [Clostridia bacterium]